MGVPKKVSQIKNILSKESVREQFQNALDENSDAFISSLIELYTNDTYLQNCNPDAVVKKALQAATLKLPLNRQLGYAYIVPFKRKGNYVPTFIIGYKGYIQLALRTNQYKALNAGKVYEGEEVEHNKLKGTYYIEGKPESDKVKGYFAHLELKSGYEKTVYMSKEDVESHAEKYSPSYGNDQSAWSTEFDTMALKTATRKLLSKWGVMSTEMITAYTQDNQYGPEEEMEYEKDEQANEQTIDVEAEETSGQGNSSDSTDAQPPENGNKGDQDGKKKDSTPKENEKEELPF